MFTSQGAVISVLDYRQGFGHTDMVDFRAAEDAAPERESGEVPVLE